MLLYPQHNEQSKTKGVLLISKYCTIYLEYTTVLILTNRTLESGTSHCTEVGVAFKIVN